MQVRVRSRLTHGVVLLAAAVAMTGLLPLPARAATTRPMAPLVPATGALFGGYVDPDNQWTGVDDAQAEVSTFESQIRRTLDVNSHFYAWWEQFPGPLEQSDVAEGRIPLVSWSGLNLDEINNGSQDDLIRARATDMRNLGAKVFLRWAWEMNGNWSSWDGSNNNDSLRTNGPAKYVTAWRRIHNLFVTQGATNVVWIWAPNAGDVPAEPWNHWTNYYPGDSFVDWVGIDGYNWGTTQPWSGWWSFASIFSPVYSDYALRKPIMVTETASTEEGGSKAKWIDDARLAIKNQFPSVAGLVWFHVKKETDWRANSSSASLASYRAMAADPYFNAAASIDPTRPTSTATAASVPPTISVDNPSVVEGPPGGNRNAIFTLSLSAPPPPGTSVSVKAVTADGSAVAGSDYTARALTTVTFAAGETTKRVPVTVTGDSLAEGNETFVLNLSAGVGAVLADAQGRATIVDEEGLPAISVSNPTVIEGAPGVTTTAMFTLSLSAPPPPGKSVSVKAVTANGSAVAPGDYTARALTTVTFAAGETTKKVPVTVRGDSVVEGNETFVLNLSSSTGAVMADSQARATIRDDDDGRGPIPPPTISVDNPWVVEGPPGGTRTAIFTLSLSAPPAPDTSVSVNAVTADASAVAGSDYTARALTTVTFAAGETTKRVPVTVTGDSLAEGNETFVLNLSAGVGAVLADPQGRATIVDEEGLPSIAVSNPTVVEGPPGATATAIFTLSLSAPPPPGRSVSVKAVTANGSAVAPGDYAARALTTVTFAAGETTKTVPVTVRGDSVVEGKETFVLNLSSPNGGVMADSQGRATILG